MVLGLGGNVLLGDGGQHHFLHDVLPQSLQGDLLGVLAGNNNCVDPKRYIFLETQEMKEYFKSNLVGMQAPLSK